MTTTAPPRHRSFTSLIDHIVADSLDGDYALAAERSSAQGIGVTGRWREIANRPAVIAVVALFGLLLGISALLTRKEAPVVDQQRSELVRIVARQQALVDAEKRTLTSLRSTVSALRTSTTSLSRDGDQLGRAGDDLEVIAASTAVSGPGARITLSDAPGAISPSSQGTVRDTDVQAVVNGLWSAGAEAVAINGQRIGPTTAIRFAGEAITVNYRSLISPYTILAIGDRNTMPAAFAETQGGQLVSSLRSSLNVRYSITTVASLTLPADSRDHVRYATVDTAQTRRGGN